MNRAVVFAGMVVVFVGGVFAWASFARIGLEDVIGDAPLPTVINEVLPVSPFGAAPTSFDSGVALVEEPRISPPAIDPVSIMAFAQRTFVGDDFTVGQVLAEYPTYTRYYITYTSSGLRISGIMNVPRGDGPFPLLVLNHGYIDPAIYTNGRGLKREQDYLARQGYVIIHPDYRNHADSDIDPDADRQFRFGYAEDVINLVLAVQRAGIPYIDTQRVGMLGHSMGGGVAWRIAVARPDLVDAFVQFAPVSADERDNFEKWVRRRTETAQAIIADHGEPAANPTFWDNVSPITFLKNIEAPVMIHHGTADDSVPLAWSERVVNELESLGEPVVFHVYPSEPHEFIDAWPQVMQRTAAFFDTHVKE